jgi:hypothetical protein
MLLLTDKHEKKTGTDTQRQMQQHMSLSLQLIRELKNQLEVRGILKPRKPLAHPGNPTKINTSRAWHSTCREHMHQQRRQLSPPVS